MWIRRRWQQRWTVVAALLVSGCAQCGEPEPEPEPAPDMRAEQDMAPGLADQGRDQSSMDPPDEGAPPDEGSPEQDMRPDMPPGTPEGASVAIVTPPPGAVLETRRADVTIRYELEEPPGSDTSLELRVGGRLIERRALEAPDAAVTFEDVLVHEGAAPSATRALSARVVRAEQVVGSVYRPVDVARGPAALEQLRAVAKDGVVDAAHDAYGQVVAARMDAPAPGADTVARARGVLRAHGALFGVGEADQAALAGLERFEPRGGGAPLEVVIFQQMHEGVEVLGARLVVVVRQDRLLLMRGRWASDLAPAPAGALGSKRAVEIAADALGITSPTPRAQPRRVWWDDRTALAREERDGLARPPEPAWAMRLPVQDGQGGQAILHVVVGAASGQVLEQWSTARALEGSILGYDLEGVALGDCQALPLSELEAQRRCQEELASVTCEAGASAQVTEVAEAALAMRQLLDASASGGGWEHQPRQSIRLLPVFAGAAGPSNYLAPCHWARINRNVTEPLRATGHEIAHARIDRVAGLINRGGAGATSEGLAYTWAALLVERRAGSGCELICPGQGQTSWPDHLEDYLDQPRAEHDNGRILQTALELMAFGGVHPDAGAERAGIGLEATSELLPLATHLLGGRRRGLQSMGRALEDAAWLISSLGDGAPPCQILLALEDVGLRQGDSVPACELDAPSDEDGDGIPDARDVCPQVIDLQRDTDADGTGDACEDDLDGDGLLDDQDPCPESAQAAGCADTDADGVPDAQDVCPTQLDPEQRDTDADGAGDACDVDADADGLEGDDDLCPRLADDGADADGDGLGDACDACPNTPGAGGEDLDADGIGDACDPDVDGDEVIDSVDNCPRRYNPDQSEYDGDGQGLACDTDMRAAVLRGQSLEVSPGAAGAIDVPICQGDCEAELASAGAWRISVALPEGVAVSPAVVDPRGDVVAWLAPLSLSERTAGDILHAATFVPSPEDLARAGAEVTGAPSAYTLRLFEAGSVTLADLSGPVTITLHGPSAPAGACEDGELGPRELCEKEALRGVSCEALGFDGGPLACGESCRRFDTRQCEYCGDGIANGDEQCDGDDFAMNCFDAGYIGPAPGSSSLGCNQDCTVDVSSCDECTNELECMFFGNRPSCLSSGVCGCTSDPQCSSALADSSKGTRCLGSGACGCTGDADCPEPDKRPMCLSSGECGCMGDADCGPSRPYCRDMRCTVTP